MICFSLLLNSTGKKNKQTKIQKKRRKQIFNIQMQNITRSNITAHFITIRMTF